MIHPCGRRYHHLGTEASSGGGAGVISGSCRRYQASDPSKKIRGGVAANYPHGRRYHHLRAKVGSGEAAEVISGSCRRYQASEPSEKNRCGPVMNHPRARRYHHLSAEAGSGGGTGMISGSCRRNQASDPSAKCSAIEGISHRYHRCGPIFMLEDKDSYRRSSLRMAFRIFRCHRAFKTNEGSLDTSFGDLKPT
jgi:hypothetical protein